MVDKVCPWQVVKLEVELVWLPELHLTPAMWARCHLDILGVMKDREGTSFGATVLAQRIPAMSVKCMPLDIHLHVAC